jgi:LPS O-antigen subunit length determinant protein (WzzB/FepE family)
MPLSIVRIALLALLISLASTSISAKEWTFDVFLDKSKMGQHTFTLNDNKLTSTAKFNVKVLFIEAYAYNHKAIEQWNNGCLSQLTAYTVENKDINDVNGKLTDAGFVVDNGKSMQTLPDCTMTFAYWDPKILTQTKLLNPQNAEWLDVKVNKIGEESLAVKGHQTKATHYKLSGTLAGKQKLNIELWYTTDTNEWVALKSITPEGYLVNYVLK